MGDVSKNTQDWVSGMKPRQQIGTPNFNMEDDDDFDREMKKIRRQIVETKLVAGMDMGGSSKEDIQKQIAEVVQKEIKPVNDFIQKFDKKEETTALQQNIINPLKEKIELIESVVTNKQLSTQDQFSQVVGLLNGVSDFFKKNLSMSGTAPTGGADLGLLVELEKSKLDREERQRQHEKELKEAEHRYEIEKAERERRWQVEDRHWEEDFKLKKSESEQSQKAKEKASYALEDLVGSLADSVTVERQAMQEKAPGQMPEGNAASATPSVRIPKQYRCEVCGYVIQVQREQKLDEPITCPQCGTVFDWKEFQWKPDTDSQE